MGVGKRYELTDAAWAVVTPLLPATPRPRWTDSATSGREISNRGEAHVTVGPGFSQNRGYRQANPQYYMGARLRRHRCPVSI
jgi:transposase